MKLLKKLALAIVILLALAYTISYAGKQGWLQNTPLKNLNYEQLGVLDQENVEQAQTLAERAKETSEHMQQILGDKVQIDEQEKEKSLHEKTLEYARYLYCRQVVEDWEKE